jgi:RND family efflux transporter MFP subunit
MTLEVLTMHIIQRLCVASQWTVTGFVLCLILGGCGERKVEEAAPVIRPVKTIVVGGQVSTDMIFPAIVEAGEKAVLSFRVAGRLIELPIEEGQEIKKGQLIGRLDPRDFEIAIKEAEAQYTQAQADFQRYENLYEQDVASKQELDTRRSRRDVTRAQLAQARENLGYTRLQAPFSGQIGRRYVENHMDVQVQQEIADLNDITNVEVVFNVAEHLIKALRQDTDVEAFARFDTAPDQKFPLTFKEASNRADPATRTFEITYLMPQPKEFRLLPGMTATVQVVLSEKRLADAQQAQRFIIPAIAVMGDASGKSEVWVVDTDKMIVQKRAVKVGEMTGADGIYVLEGLKGGETLVIAGMTQLQDGMQVRLWEQQ